MFSQKIYDIFTVVVYKSFKRKTSYRRYFDGENGQASQASGQAEWRRDG